MTDSASRQSPSIRLTVLLWQFAALLLLGSVAVVATYTSAARSFTELRDLELAQIADAVARHGIDDDDGEIDQPGDFLSQVWEADGRLSYASHEPPVERPAKLGQGDFRYDNQLWHSYSAQYQGQTVLVAREAGSRGKLLASLSLPLLALLSALTLLLLVALGIRVRRALAPLEALRTTLEQRDSSSLQPVDLSPSPAELGPLVTTLNDVFGRLRGLIQTQRRFTADAAHELRTPITAIGLNAQLAHKLVDSGRRDELATHLTNIQASCTRAAAMIEQLLTLARLDAEGLPQHAPIALDALLREAVGELSVLADAQQIDLGITHAEPVTIHGDPIEWRILIDNLIGNAVRYSPPGGCIDVAVNHEGERTQVTIDDSGPGIPNAELDKVFERFHRVTGTEQPGSGLGLSIVRRIAQRNGLEVHLANRPTGGLHVVIVCPADVIG